MKKCIISLLILCLSTVAVTFTQASYSEYPSELVENVSVIVNCTTAKIITSSMIISHNTSLMHFPSTVNMADSRFEKVTAVGLIFSPDQSFLVYSFNDTDATTSRSIADQITPTIKTAFQADFTFNTVGTRDSIIEVNYTGPGKSNMPQYTQWVMSECLAPDLEGFSLTFLPMAQEPGAFIIVTASKESGGFDWTYSMTTTYIMSIPTGSENHRIDVLDQLDVGSLAPSPYVSLEEGMYTSIVNLQILYEQAVSYVSSEPGLGTPPSKGWFLSPYNPPKTFMAYFYFGDDPSPVSVLTFTFSGIVIPEFTTLAIAAILLLSTMIVLFLKKRLLKMLG